MQKENYQLKMEKIIEGFNGKKKKLLLHSCCAPCSSAVIERLTEFFDITIYYYNPNIYPPEEFVNRSAEQKRLIDEMKEIKSEVSVVIADYNEKEFYDAVKGCEDGPEGGERCRKCFELRLEQSAVYASQNNFDYFTTTLSISPHKNSGLLNTIGKEMAQRYKIEYLYADFKKKEGFKRSIILSEEYDLYRQDYCGCLFSYNEKNG